MKSFNTYGFKPRTLNKEEKKRLHDGYIIVCQQLEKDYYESLHRNNLPSDWRSRIIK